MEFIISDGPDMELTIANDLNMELSIANAHFGRAALHLFLQSERISDGRLFDMSKHR